MDNPSAPPASDSPFATPSTPPISTPPPTEPAIVTTDDSSSSPKRKLNKKVVGSLTAVLLLTIGTAIGVYALRQNQQARRGRAGGVCHTLGGTGSCGRVTDWGGHDADAETKAAAMANPGTQYMAGCSDEGVFSVIPAPFNVDCGCPTLEAPTSGCNGGSDLCTGCGNPTYICAADTGTTDTGDGDTGGATCPWTDTGSCVTEGVSASDCRISPSNPAYPNCACCPGLTESAQGTCLCETPATTQPPITTYQCNSTCTTDAQCTGSLGTSYFCLLSTDTGLGSNYTSGNCRLIDNPTSETCTPTSTTPPTVTYQCNSACTTDAQCQSDLGITYSCEGGYCRLTENPTSEICTPATDDSFSCQCLDLRVYNTNWNQLNATELSQLKSGNKIIIAAIGTSDTPEITKARFSINAGSWNETTVYRNLDIGGGTLAKEFYIEYTVPDVPTGQTTFQISIQAELYHPDFGWF